MSLDYSGGIPKEYDTTSPYTNNSTVMGNELLDALKCEVKPVNIENSILLEWGNMPNSVTSLAISIYRFPSPSD